MALSSSYVLRESAGNLRRNLFMALAAIVTVAVSLTALGAVMVMRQAITKASVQAQGGVELAIFMSPNASESQIGALNRELSITPGVKSFHFVDKTHAFQEFKEIFAGNNDITSSLSVADMPPSFRVVPSRAQGLDELGRQFSGQPGVLRVSYPAEAVHNLLKQFSSLRFYGVALGIGVLVGAVALIINTIQLAIFARRREVAVMKLVGATNWFIRIPFMLEGFIHGITGAVAAGVIVYFARNGIAGFLPNQSILGTSLTVSSKEAILTDIVLLIGGAVVGVLGSAFAVRRYLAV